MEQLGSHWMDFYEIWCMSIFRKSVEKNQVPLQSADNGTSHVDRCTVMITSSSILRRMTNVGEKSCREYQNTRFDFIFWKSCRLWDNVKKCGIAREATDNNTAHALCMLDN
jgi:hypothetical protein